MGSGGKGKNSFAFSAFSILPYNSLFSLQGRADSLSKATDKTQAFVPALLPLRSSYRLVTPSNRCRRLPSERLLQHLPEDKPRREDGKDGEEGVGEDGVIGSGEGVGDAL
jgi:hypothetical protein